MELPGEPNEWYAHLAVIAKHEIFRRMRMRNTYSLPMSVSDMIATLVADTWIAIAKVERALENVWGYARIVMRYSLSTYVERERARRWIAAPAIEEEDDEGYNELRDSLSIDRTADLELAIAGRALDEKYRHHRDKWVNVPEVEARSRQAEQQRRARFEAWYLNSKRRRYD